LAALVGLPASVGLALVDLRLPIVLGGFVAIALGLFYVLAMDETGHVRPEEEDRGWRALAVTARDGARLVRGRPLLLLIMGISAIWGLWSQGLDRLSEAHFLTEIGLPELAGLDPVVWFGIFGGGGLLLSIFVAAPLRRRFEAAKAAELVRILFVLDVVLIAGTIAFGLAGALAVALGARWIVGIARSLAMPLYSTWLNQSIEDSRVRATVISITNQADAVGQWTGGPALGVVGTVFSIRAALVVAGLALSPALALYGRAIRRQSREPELASPQAVM
jgi:hypothetical protein